jgi:ribosomal protein S18 acetylase RimI-like enzyme
MNSINLRLANLDDVTNLVVLKQQVWVSTYAIEGIQKEYSVYLLDIFTLENEKAILEDQHKFTLIAEFKGHLIGCAEVNLNPSESIPQIENIPEISRLYVLERFCGKGIGKMLLNETISALKKINYNGVWLSAYHKNQRAINFYKQNGFNDIGKLLFDMNGNKYENRILINEF